MSTTSLNRPMTGPYPLRLTGRLDTPISGGLWLVKWLLLVPHAIVLFFLWIAFVLLTVAAFFAILVTGRYPRALFDFNSGVLRWSWRVGFYGYSALATDRYPPFSLDDDPDYPARLEIDYPESLSRGLVLVKWWLLAIPHYLLISAASGAIGASGDRRNATITVSVVTLAVVYAGVSLLFRSRYPRGLFDLVMGLNRWGYRVAAYVSLMTDAYPPFRLDQGGPEGPVAPTPSGEPSQGAAGAVQDRDQQLGAPQVSQVSSVSQESSV